MQAETVVLMITIVVSVLGSSLGTIRILLHQMNRMESRLTDQIKENRTAIGENRDAIHENRIRIERCSAQLEEHDRRFDAMDARFDRMDGRMDRMSERQEDHQNETQKVRETVARVEGFLMGSGEFRLSTSGSLTGEDPPASG